MHTRYNMTHVPLDMIGLNFQTCQGAHSQNLNDLAPSFWTQLKMDAFFLKLKQLPFFSSGITLNIQMSVYCHATKTYAKNRLTIKIEGL